MSSHLNGSVSFGRVISTSIALLAESLGFSPWQLLQVALVKTLPKPETLENTARKDSA